MKTIQLDNFSDFVKWVSKREKKKMTTTPASPLEPCPWCGKIPKIEEHRGFFEVDCCIAGIGLWNNKQELIAAWNGGVLRERLKAAEAEAEEIMDGNATLCEQLSAAEARVKELEQMRMPCNQTTGMDYAIEALERGIREGWEARNEKYHVDIGDASGVVTVSDFKWATVDHYLKERKK